MTEQNISHGALNDRYVFQWIGRCCYQTDTEKSDKVWGWFYYNDPTQGYINHRSVNSYDHAYVFWGPTGKTLKFKKHPNHTYDLKGLMRKKIVHKYEQMSYRDFVSSWDDLYSTINDKFIFHLLANDI